MKRRRIARGFTLLELLIVLGIIVFLASITTVVALRMTERDQVPRGATTIQGMLALAKARAASERVNTGIRLVLKLNKFEMQNITDVDGDNEITLFDLNAPANFPSKIKHRNTNVGPVDYLDVLAPTTLGGLADGLDNDANQWTDDLILAESIEYIHDPGDFSDMLPIGGGVKTAFQWTTGAGAAPLRWQPTAGGFDHRNKLFLFRSDSNFNNSPLNIQNLSNFVQPGDRIELLDLGQIYTVLLVERWDDPNDNPDMGSYNRITLDRNVEGALGVSPYDPVEPDPQNTVTPLMRYRIIRQPRPIPGEKPQALPSGAVLDLRATQLASDGRTFDILFSPRGNVVGTTAAQDMIFLWIHDARSGIVDNQVLVTVYPRTGATLVFPVDLAGTDMYSFARTGRAANTP